MLPDLSHLSCIIYVRVSTEDQAEKYSLPSQIRFGEEKAVKLAWRTDKSLVIVDKRSGKDTNRPGWQKVMELVKARQVRGVICYSLDRAFRSVADAAYHRKEFAKLGVGLDFVNLELGDTAVDNLIFHQMAALAEFERELIIERSERGRAQKLRQGHIPTGPAPFGYRFVGKREGSRGHFEVVERDAAIVRRMFQWADQGLSLYEISQRLNEEGIVTPRKGLKNSRDGKINDGRWSRTVIHQIVTNRTYTGEYQWGRHTPRPVTLSVPALISAEVFDRVQVQRQKVHEAFVGRPSKTYLLGGFLFCRKCGHRWTTSNNGGSRSVSYRCNHIDVRDRSRRLCDAPRVLTSRLDNFVWATVWETITSPGTLRKLVKEYYDGIRSQAGTSKVEQLEQTIVRLKAQVKRQEQVRDDPRNDYAQAMEKLEAYKRGLTEAEVELAGLVKVVRMPPWAEVEAALAEITGHQPETLEDRKAVLREIVERIETDGASVLILHCRIVPGAAENCNGDARVHNKSVASAGKCYGHVDVHNKFRDPIRFTIERRLVA